MDSLGGYRILRTLGEGARAQVLLARVDDDGEPGEPTEPPVAIKRYREGVEAHTIHVELEALARAAGDHAVELLDVASAPDGALALVLARLPGGSLGRLLAARHDLDPGEAVTALAPLGALVDRMHAAGVVHRGIRLESVLFDDTGAPTLACFGRAELIEPGLPPAGLELEAGVIADRRAVASLALAVLDRVPPHPAVFDLLDWLDSGAEHPSWGAQFAERVLAIAPAAPIELGADPAATPVAIPGRVPLAATTAGEAGRGRSRPRERGADRARRTAAKPGASHRGALPAYRGIPSEVEHGLVEPDPVLGPRRAAALQDEPARPSLADLVPEGLLGRILDSVRAVRARVWVLAAVVAAALGTALVLVPHDDQPSSADAPPPSSPPPATPSSTPSPPSPALLGDDPVAALVELAQLRDGCLRDRSVACLADVVQAGSSALADDEALIRGVDAGAELPRPWVVDAARVTVVEDLGDGVLLAIAVGQDGQETEPASVLVMRTEAGWRIRAYLA